MLVQMHVQFEVLTQEEADALIAKLTAGMAGAAFTVIGTPPRPEIGDVILPEVPEVNP